VNLFEECCRRYGQMNGKARLFSLSETLALFAILIHRQFETAEVQTRLRTLRNLTDRSDEIRDNRMVDLIDSVERLIRYGAIEDLKGFNPDRILDEQAKREFLDVHPDQESVLRATEDHPLLRGRVFAFDLDAAMLAKRFATFCSVTQREHWPSLTAALLSMGNYGYPIFGDRAYQFGSPKGDQELRWREVFTHHGRGKNGELTTALRALLDAVADDPADTGTALTTIARRFSQARLEDRELDWRYYLVTYPAMREGDTGIYFGEHLPTLGGWGYSMCMLRTGSITGGAHYRDPYLLAALRESRVGDAVKDPWFSGYESDERWLRLAASEAGIRCVNLGFELEPPLDEQQAERFRRVCEEHRAAEGLLAVAQVDRGGALVDTEDRVLKCAALLKDLVAAGL
ncbi:MAG: hypothetical protein WA006_03820, partial [Rhodoglobus sp.]